MEEITLTDNMMKMNDENGNPIDCIYICSIEKFDRKFSLFTTQNKEKLAETQFLVLEEINKNGQISYIGVNDENEFSEVQKLLEEKLKTLKIIL